MISPLQQLSCSDLFALAEAMQSGRIAPPFTSLALQRYCSGADAASVARELQEWADGGVGTEVLARMVKLLADEYKHLTRSSPEESVDLVLTGPEVPGTTCRDTGVVLRELFCGANQSVMVAGYAVYQGKEVFRALADRMAEIPDLEVQMFLDVQRRYGDSTEPLELLRQFVHRFKTQDWPGTVMPQIYYDPRSLEMDKDKRSSLHAKCVVVDSRIAFVSSANFTEAAQVRNIEVGVVIRSEHMAKKLAGHFQALADAGVLKRL